MSATEGWLSRAITEPDEPEPNPRTAPGTRVRRFGPMGSAYNPNPDGNGVRVPTTENNPHPSDWHIAKLTMELENYRRANEIALLARKGLFGAIRDAHAAGVSWGTLAGTLGVTRQRVAYMAGEVPVLPGQSRRGR